MAYLIKYKDPTKANRTIFAFTTSTADAHYFAGERGVDVREVPTSFLPEAKAKLSAKAWREVAAVHYKLGKKVDPNKHTHHKRTGHYPKGHNGIRVTPVSTKSPSYRYL